MVEMGSFTDSGEDFRSIIKALKSEIMDLQNQINKKDDAIKELKDRINLLNGMYNQPDELIIVSRKE